MKLKEKINKLNNMLSSCTLCPHRCRVNRYSGKKGFCGAGTDAVISSAMPHHGEEPPISGEKGSGTIFFSYCNMKCVYCQNWQISQEHEGNPVSVEELAEKMLDLQKRGVHNINLVSPTIWIPQIVEALESAYSKGFKLPLVYNTGGYDNPEIIKALDGIIDIYMPDMRYSSDSMAEKYSSVKNYVKYNRESVTEMYRQVGNLELDNRGIAKRGLMVRLLVMPGGIAGIKDTIDFISKNLSNKVYLSIMAQYHPAYRAHNFSELSGRITYKEYMDVLDYAAHGGFEYGWTQDYNDLDHEKDLFIPDFKDKNVFRYYRK
jgi:putative pyruvate formate lyase activating enzyme